MCLNRCSRIERCLCLSQEVPKMVLREELLDNQMRSYLTQIIATTSHSRTWTWSEKIMIQLNLQTNLIQLPKDADQFCSLSREKASSWVKPEDLPSFHLNSPEVSPSSRGRRTMDSSKDQITIASLRIHQQDITTPKSVRCTRVKTVKQWPSNLSAFRVESELISLYPSKKYKLLKLASNRHEWIDRSFWDHPARPTQLTTKSIWKTWWKVRITAKVLIQPL